MHLVTLVTSGDVTQNGGYIILSNIPEKPMLYANVTALCLIERVLSKFYIVGIGIFDVFVSCDLDLDPMTFMYELNPYTVDTCTASANMNFMCEGFRKLSADIHAYIHDRHDLIYIPRFFAGGQ